MEDFDYLESVDDGNEPDINFEDFYTDGVDIVEEKIEEEVTDKKEQTYQKCLKELSSTYSSEERQNKIKILSETFDKEIDNVESDFEYYLRTIVTERLKKIYGLKDKFKKAIQSSNLDKFLSNFIPDKKERQNTLNYLMLEDGEIEIYRIKDLLDIKQKSEDRWLVSGLFPLGQMILLAAQAKTFKSMLAYELSVSVLLGREFFGKKVNKGNILYIQNEEDPYQIGKRVWGNGLQNLELQNPELYKELIESHQLTVVKGLDIGKDIDLIFEIIEKYNVNLLVIDTLSSSIMKSGLSEMVQQDIQPVLQDLQRRSQEQNIFTLVLHHSNKGDSNKNKQEAFDKVSGSSSIVRVNDGVLKLLLKTTEESVTETNEYGNPIVVVDFTPRNGQPCTFEIGMVEEEALFWYFEVYSETLMTEGKLKITMTVLRELYEEYEKWKTDSEEKKDLQVYGLSLKKLMKRTQTLKKDLTPVLNYLLRTDCLCLRSEKGVFIYHIPEDGTTWLDDKFHDFMNKENEKSEKLQLMRNFMSAVADCKTYNELKEVSNKFFNVKDLDRDAIKNVIVPDLSNVLGVKIGEIFIERVIFLRQPPKFKLNDKVKIKTLNTVYQVVEILKNDITANKKGFYRLYNLVNVEDEKDIVLKMDQDELEFADLKLLEPVEEVNEEE